MIKQKTYLYLIKLYNENESFYKIGISVNKFSRFYQIMKHGYKCKIVLMLCCYDYSYFLELEGFLQNWFNKDSYIPKNKFGGYTECFINIDVSEYIIIADKLNLINDSTIKNLEISWR